MYLLVYSSVAGTGSVTVNDLPKENKSSDTSNAAKNAVGDSVVEDWRPVRSKKNKQTTPRAKSQDNKSFPMNSIRQLSTKDELTFLMDEDLSDLSLAGRKKAYTDYDDFDDELDDYEISDHDLSKIIIVMQTPAKPNKPSSEHVYDRTGDWTTRVKVTQEMCKIINDGLFYYEQDLWATDGKQHKTLGIISQEDFELYSGSPKKSTCATPPPPPPPTYVDEDIELDENFLSGKWSCL